MKRKQKNKINIKSNSGFTMADLIAALTIFMIFTGVICGLFYSAYKVSLETKLSSTALSYAIAILEDIDKISYDDVINGMETKYIRKFSIAEGFNLSLEVTNYNEGTTKEDLIKKVKLTISYNISGQNQEIVINKMKMKEIP